MRAESEEVADRLSGELRETDILVGISLPRGFREVTSGTIDDLINANSERVLVGQEILEKIQKQVRDRQELIQREVPVLDREKLEEWAHSTYIRGATRMVGIKSKIVSNIERVSFDEFQENLDSSIDALNRLLREDNEPYVQILGANPHKSNRWVYELSKDKIKVTPKETSYFNIIKDSNLERWIDEGIDTFVIMDDASYSGNQFYDSFLKPLARAYSGSGKKPTIYFVVPYTTQYAEQNLMNLARGRNVDLHIVSQKRIKTIKEILDENEIISYSTPNPGVGLTYFDHKVPDSLSFDERVSLYFKPEYRRFEYPVYARKGNYYEIEEREWREYLEQTTRSKNLKKIP